MKNNQSDQPSSIDLREMPDALEWERRAMLRPFRKDFFEAFRTELSRTRLKHLQVLELGSGPGFLAEYLLERLPELHMTLLDFSPAMHKLARKRLAQYQSRVTYLQCDFSKPDWTKTLSVFDAVITLQAIHELRHKRHASTFHQQVKKLLPRNNSLYLACDHYYGSDGMDNKELFMTLSEQEAALESAGFTVKEVLVKGGRALFRAS